MSDGVESRWARPEVSVVVPCRNEASHIRGCLESILRQEPLSDGRAIEILVADGQSDDGTRALVASLAERDSRIRLIDNPGKIVSTGLNLAIRAALGSIIIRMDAHTEYAPDYIARSVATLEETGADNVGGPWSARSEDYLGRAIAAAFQSSFACGGGRAHDLDYEGELDTVYLGCWRKQTLLRVGFFDEELVRNQDDELNFRLVRGGGRIWQSPRIRSWYRPRSSLRALFRQYRQYGYWKVRVIQKHGQPASLRHLVPVAFVLHLCFGWLFGFVHASLWVVYAAPLLAYALLDVVFSVAAATRAGWDLLPALFLVFFVYHLSYGLGFAQGVLDFLVLRQRPRSSMSLLTRTRPRTTRQTS